MRPMAEQPGLGSDHGIMEHATGIDPAGMTSRTLKTLLVTDMVDSTSLVDVLGDDRSVQIFERHDQLARELLLRFNGLEIDKTDGFLFLFDRPIDAAFYALEFHEALVGLSAEMKVKLAARAGIHLGEIVLRRNRPEFVARGAKPIEVEGLAKPMAARIMSLAQGAQTLVTRTAFDLARRAAVGREGIPKDIRWVSHGAYRFKGIDEPQMIFEVGRKGRAPFAPPPNTAKAWRSVAAPVGEDAVWRPAPGLSVPGRAGWKLESRLGHGEAGEIWLASQPRQVSDADRTLAIDAQVTPSEERERRAFLFWRSSAEAGGPERASSWQLADPIACVVVQSGEQRGAFALLTQRPLTGGRESDMDLRLHDPKVSRRHFEIVPRGDAYVVREVQTKNGVYVNGHRIRGKQLLQNGDEIRAGETVLVFFQEPTGDRTIGG